MLAAIKSFFGEIFGSSHDDGGGGGGGGGGARIGGFGDIAGFGAEHGFGDRWGATELGGNAPREARIAEAAYEARLQNNVIQSRHNTRLSVARRARLHLF